MTVGEKEDGRRKKTVGEEVWREKKNSWIERTVGGKRWLEEKRRPKKAKNGQKKAGWKGRQKY